MLFDRQARVVESTLTRRTYQVRTTGDGGAELDADMMFEAFTGALDEVLTKVKGTRIAAVAASSLASSVLGVDQFGKALTPAFLYSDTRDAEAVEELRSRVEWEPIYKRTGCPLHTSYLPARFLWLRETLPDIFGRAARWLSLHEYFMLKLFGQTIICHSLAAWTGMLNRMQLDWDDGVLDIVGVRREQLSTIVSARESLSNLESEFLNRWGGLAGARFFPAIGDGAAANIGSGCTDASRVAVTVGTSGALRAVVPTRPPARIETQGDLGEGRAETHNQDPMPSFSIPAGLWLYSADERRGLLGGSLNNGGNVFAYLHNTLRLPESNAEEAELEALEPDGHGLTILPFFAGERSPGYHGDARAAIVGLNLETTPKEILRATFEAIAYRMASIFDLMREVIPQPRDIIASGSALLNSSVWVQIIADVLERAVTVSGEGEATARGAALIALEVLGVIRDVAELAPAFGKTYSPDPVRFEAYRRGRVRQEQLYSLLIAKG